ncbi:MAG: hypothetical protein PUE48_03775 [Eubacterium coprostanoligenes]|uniref:hypothetical protein n=1 Tax=Eubacterium coprostanoligenes TaxID=290054 RepID=UPI00240995EA|nr:hypothetical protein [Eubacterium coprostanoligenes]MDD6665443.1 hypothetical protein [Eubacterium coprostanoligenes]
MWSKEEYEKYAISVLGLFYPEIINMIKGESPDYNNTSIGIEVTRAITTKNGEVDAFWKKHNGMRFRDLSQKQLKKMGFNVLPVQVDSRDLLYVQKSFQNGSLYYYKEKGTDELILFIYFGRLTSNETTSDDIMRAISVKLKKLNNNYKLFSRNDLCILIQEQLNYCACQEEIIDDLMDLVISSVKRLINKSNQNKKYDNIFLLFLDNLFRISTETWEYERNVITQDCINQVISKVGI